MVLYLTRLANRVIKPFGNKALEQLVLLGAVNFYDYVFSLEERCWVRVCDISDVDHQMIRESIDYEEMSFETPNFVPPTILEIPKFELTPEQRIEQLEEALVEKDGLIESLNQQVSTLESHLNENHQKIQESEEKEGASESIIRELQLQIEKLNEQQSEFSEEEYREKMSILEKQNESFETQVSGLNEEIDTLVEEMTQIVDENNYLKKQVQKYKKGFINQKEMTQALKSNVKKLNQGMVKLQSYSEKTKMKVQDLEKYKAAQERKEKEELQVLIGDSFEIDNSPQWIIQLEGEEKGPFQFEDVLGFLNYKKISKETPVKRSSDSYWQTVAHFQEFNAKIITNEEEVDGKIIKRFYMKRGEFRAPFYETAIIEVDDKEFRGYCTSLSVGGCFFETPRVSNRHYEIGAQVKVRIVEGTLSREISAMAVIRSLSKEKPKGLGLQFVLIGDDEKEIINEYVNNYIASTTKAS